MATFEEAEQVRDRIADELLDGRRVHSVGIERHDGDYAVGVTASVPVQVPELPPELAGVTVDVVLIPGPATAHHGPGNGMLARLKSLLG